MTPRKLNALARTHGEINDPKNTSNDNKQAPGKLGQGQNKGPQQARLGYIDEIF